VIGGGGAKNVKVFPRTPARSEGMRMTDDEERRERGEYRILAFASFYSGEK